MSSVVSTIQATVVVRDGVAVVEVGLVGVLASSDILRQVQTLEGKIDLSINPVPKVAIVHESLELDYEDVPELPLLTPVGRNGS